MRKAYIIMYNKGGVLDLFDYKEFHNNITIAKGVISWWHYIDNAYIIITEKSTLASNISDFVKQKMPNKQFVVLELNLKNHNGWLPKEAWDWIDTYKNG